MEAQALPLLNGEPLPRSSSAPRRRRATAVVASLIAVAAVVAVCARRGAGGGSQPAAVLDGLMHAPHGLTITSSSSHNMTCTTNRDCPQGLPVAAFAAGASSSQRTEAGRAAGGGTGVIVVTNPVDDDGAADDVAAADDAAALHSTSDADVYACVSGTCKQINAGQLPLSRLDASLDAEPS